MGATRCGSMARRMMIKGSSGAGKSTLAAELARRFGLVHVELDALYHGPDWSPASPVELRARVADELDNERGWVVDGNYDGPLGSLVLDRADLVVWLDLPLPTKLLRLMRRSALRWLGREALWNGNRESLSAIFGGRKSLFGSALRMHFHHRRPSNRRRHLRVRALGGALGTRTGLHDEREAKAFERAAELGIANFRRLFEVVGELAQLPPEVSELHQPKKQWRRRTEFW